MDQAQIPRRERGGGTLTTEPLLVFRHRQRHSREFAVLDQSGQHLGRVVPAGKGLSAPYEFVDMEDQCLLRLRRVREGGLLARWLYELSNPHLEEVIQMRQINRSSNAEGSVMRGPQEIATFRFSGSGPDQVIVEEGAQGELVRVRVIRRWWPKRLAGSTHLLKLAGAVFRGIFFSPEELIVVEIAGRATDELRGVGWAMAIVLDRELLSQRSGG